MTLQQRFETNTIDFLTPKWDFVWNGIKPMNKEEFINDLKNHAKSNITKDEITILCKMFDLPKPPSLLNNEHKKLIKESLKIAVAYDKTKDYDETLQKEIQSIVDKKDSTPKKEKEKAKAKEAGLDMGIM